MLVEHDFKWCCWIRILDAFDISLMDRIMFIIPLFWTYFFYVFLVLDSALVYSHGMTEVALKKKGEQAEVNPINFALVCLFHISYHPLWSFQSQSHECDCHRSLIIWKYKKPSINISNISVKNASWSSYVLKAICVELSSSYFYQWNQCEVEPETIRESP